MSLRPTDDAWSIIAAVRRGETMQCHAYTLLLVQCLAALGYTARQCWCGLHFEPREHVVVEAWSPELLKWILLNPDYDLTYVRDGVPLAVPSTPADGASFRARVSRMDLRDGDSIEREPDRRKALLGEFLSMRPELLGGIQVLRGGSRKLSPILLKMW